MKKIVVSIAMLFVVLAGAAEILVAPAGAPYSTVKDALAAAREIKAKNPSEKVTITFRAGVYKLDEPVYLQQDMSDLVIKAAQGEKVVFDGGWELADWKKSIVNGREVLTASVPDGLARDGRINQLFVNGKRAQVAMLPKDLTKGFRIKKPVIANGDDPDMMMGGIELPREIIDSNSYNPTGMEVHIISHWTDTAYAVERYDSIKNIVWLNNSRLLRSKIHQDNFGLHATCFLHNVREAMTEPGEFYYDSIRREINYIPRPGETAENITASIPRRSVMFVASGSDVQGTGKKISNVVLDGITFRHGGRGRFLNNSSADYHFVGNERFTSPRILCHFTFSFQSCNNSMAQVVFYLAENCTVRNCTVENGGLYGIGILSGCRDVEVHSNTVRDIGVGGIIVNGANAERHSQQSVFITERISLVNNHIHDIGKVYLQGAGILLGFARGNLIEHNLIHDTYYTGISAGWSWGFATVTGGENRIGYNHIYNIGRGVLSDMGGIYLLGIQPGTRVYNNLIHDVKHNVYGGWGIYFDEGSSQQIIERNVCYDCSSHGWHNNYGRENIVRDNLFAFNAEGGGKFSLGKEFGAKTFKWLGENYTYNANILRNIVITNDVPFVQSSIINENMPGFYCDNNWYLDVSGKATAEKGFVASKPKYKTFHDYKEWKSWGFDRNTAFGDPGFVDAAKRDFRYRPDSAAKAAGFYDFAETLDKAGLFKE